MYLYLFFFFFSSRRRHTRFDCDWSSDVCSSDLLSTFFERLRQFGLEGKALLYARDRGRGAGPDAFRFVGGDWSDAERVLRRVDLLLNFHYAIDPRLLACARRTALVDIDPGLLQFWISTGQLNVPAHDCYLDRKSTRLNSSHSQISYAVFCLKKKKNKHPSSVSDST